MDKTKSINIETKHEIVEKINFKNEHQFNIGGHLEEVRSSPLIDTKCFVCLSVCFGLFMTGMGVTAFCLPPTNSENCPTCSSDEIETSEEQRLAIGASFLAVGVGVLCTVGGRYIYKKCKAENGQQNITNSYIPVNN
jgi:hypothetical protein